MSRLADWLLHRDEDDPFAPVKPRRSPRGRVVEALPEGLRGNGKGKPSRRAPEITPHARLRAANGVPEAVVKVASYGGGRASAVQQLDYISRDGELQVEMSDGTVLDGREDIRELVDEWAADFHHRKGGARNTIHMVVSTPPGSDREAALEAGRGFAAETFGDNHPYALVRHDDGEHPHVHIVARMRGDDGSLFRIERGEFHELRERFAEQCRAHGIEMNATPRQLRGAARSEPIALRKMRARGDTPEIDKRAAELVAQERAPSAAARDAMETRQAALAREAKAHRALAETFEKAAERNEARRAQMTAQAGKLRGLADYLDAGGAETRPERVRGGRERGDGREAEASRKGAPVAVQERPAPEVEVQTTPPRRKSEQVRKIREMEKRRRERDRDRDRDRD